MDVVIHQPQLVPFLTQEWSLESLAELETLLEKEGTLQFRALPNGLFPAAISDDYTGYSNIWVRDNIHLANSFLELGETETAVATISGLTKFFLTQQRKIEQIIAGDLDFDDPMNRPHIRFNGTTLSENAEKWSHAQNDALGYYLWLTSRVIESGDFHLSADEMQLLALFPRLFRALRFWEDKDSGHWEEARKVEASSIGTATRGLQAFASLLAAAGELPGISTETRESLVREVEEMISYGIQTLAKTLPWECRADDPKERRRTDAALLFLIAPLGLLAPTDPQAMQIVDDVQQQLQGEIGIRRYLGDSYWCADYKTIMSEESRTADVSDDMSSRDALLKPGEEAQWCIFDPMLSVIFGQRFLITGEAADHAAQIFYLNRSLGQITGPGGDSPEFRCPESYFLSDGKRIPNDVTPLLWTQANLRLALHQVKLTLS